jgi:capsular exopolysaccharide synthesis family protein
MAGSDHSTTDWLQPPGDQGGLKRYIETISERKWLILAVVAITTLLALVYVLSADKVYEAEADLLVAPVADDSGANLAGLGLLIESNDPVRAVETAATVVETETVAARAVETLGLDRTPSSILDDVSVDPVATSNVITITAEASSPVAAADLANAFAEAAVSVRTQEMHRRIDDELPRLEARLKAFPPGTAQDLLASQIAELEGLRAGDDPTLQVSQQASAPDSPVSPRPVASIAAGILAGLVLGIGGAFALQALDPRLRREEQLRARYLLPVLARVPRQRQRKDEPLAWDQLSPDAIEAYRALGTILARPLARSGGAGAILVTSPGPSEGKSTTALNLATSLALSGKRVILIEADLRHPAIGKALGMSVDRGVVSVLIERTRLHESLVSARVGGDNLQLLLAEQVGVAGGELLALPAAQRLVDEAKMLADYVIVDSPPLATVIDALPLARTVDDLLVVVRLGETRLNRIQELAELLAESEIKPSGFAVVGVPRVHNAYYGDYRRRLRSERAEPRIATRQG